MKRTKKKSKNNVWKRFTRFFPPRKKTNDLILPHEEPYDEIGDLFPETDNLTDTLEIPTLMEDVGPWGEFDLFRPDPEESDSSFPFGESSESDGGERRFDEPTVHVGGTAELPIYLIDTEGIRIKDAINYKRAHTEEFWDLIEYEMDKNSLVPGEKIPFTYLATPCELIVPSNVVVLSDTDKVCKLIVERPRAYYRFASNSELFPMKVSCAVDDKHYALFACEKDLAGKALMMGTYATLSPAQREHVKAMANRPVCAEEGGTPNEDAYTPIRDEKGLRMMYKLCRNTYSPNVRARADQLIAELRSASHSDRTNLLNQLAITIGIDTVPKQHPHRTYEEHMAILDKYLYGMRELKESIVEFIMAMQMSGNTYFSILLVGPPGVGKTCICDAVAECMSVPVVHIDCSGVDCITMNGLIKSYSGAKPGKVVDGFAEIGATDVLMRLDEVDKMSRNKEGDPYGALIKPLGPHRKYFDEFVADDIDVSATKFVATANDVTAIPGYILSRFQNCIFYIDPYTADEKTSIARDYIVPKHLKEYNLTPEECTFEEEALRLIVDEYCNDEGVRELEGNVILLLRKALTEYARGMIEMPVCIDCAYVKNHLRKNKLTKGKSAAGFAS